MIEPEAHQKIETIRSTLINCYPDDIRKAIARKTILSDPAFAIWESTRHACFYAPFDWVNEQADIVLIGITPGMQQAETAILALQSQLKKGATAEAAAYAAKSEASFKGEMRTIVTCSPETSSN